MEDHLPVINLELNSGVFRIKTAEAIYLITVTPDSTLTKVVEKVVEREVVKPSPEPVLEETSQLDENDVFYREISEELYGEIGKLARQLSLSIKEIPESNFKGLNLEQTGKELEDAKGQLEDIVHMTEKATMDIMDLTETIQEDLFNIQGKLTSIKDLEFMLRQESSDLDWGDMDDTVISEDEPPAPSLPDIDLDFFTTLVEQENKLREMISGLPTVDENAAPPEPAPQPAAAPEPQVVKKTLYKFDVDVIFQTMYELCTNEMVKEHIKAMRNDQNTAFDQTVIVNSLSELAPTVDVEDNFYNFPITSILKGLFSATTNEKYKQILKKMNQTAASIFLDSVLPIEGETEEQEITVEAPAAAPQPAPTPAPPVSLKPGLPPEQIDELLQVIDETVGLLDTEKERLAQSIQELKDTPPTPAGEEDFTRVANDDREKIVNTVENTSEIIQRIMTHINRILEALSFQDLSGQRIFKIVRIISQVQVQLLSLLVAYGAKFKRKKESVETKTTKEQETERMAQEEVDKMLEKVAPVSSIDDLKGPDADGRLNQGAVDGLLADLGF